MADPVIRTPLGPVALTAAGQSATIDLTRGAHDPDGYPLRVASARVLKPAHGTVVIDRAAARTASSARASLPTSITYTPRPGWRGTDTVAYVLANGHGGTVAGTVRVTTPNAAPVAATDTVTAASAWGASTATRVDVLANDSDPNGDTLTVTALTQPAHGSVALADGAVLYTPVAGYSGPDSFDYTVADGHGATATGSVVVTVGPPPDRLPALDGSPRTIGDDDTAVITVPDDPDGDPLTVTASATAGSVTVAGQRITYTPPFGRDSDATVSYTVSDGITSASATVEVQATAPRSVLGIVNQHALPLDDAGYLKTRPAITGVPAGRQVRVTITVTGLTDRGFANDQGEACPALVGAGPLVCTVTGTGGTIELGHYDPYATSIQVSVKPIDFVADDVSWSYP
jgi:hypothetical protein